MGFTAMLRGAVGDLVSCGIRIGGIGGRAFPESEGTLLLEWEGCVR